MIFASDLTWILLLPVIGALAAYATPARIARWLALLFAAATFVLSLVIFFRIAANGYNFGNLNNPAESIHLPWIDFTASNVRFKIDYFLGVDGLSLPLVILNALLSMLAIIGGWEKPRVKEYMALLLLLETGVMGVFLSLDLLLFFLFWEVELAPMFLLIGIWGYDTPRHGMPGRIYSAWKFLLYTFFGSIFMLAGILLLYFKLGGTTASMQYFSTHFLSGTVTIPLFGITMSLQLLTFLLSVILAGILLKMGAYGLIRVCLTLLPAGTHAFSSWLIVIGVINILYGAGICLVQTDMKRLIAYSSVSHMGVILLGVGAAAATLTTGNRVSPFGMAALTGASVQMISHGLITGMLFFCVGVVSDRAHTREIAIFGGIAKKMPLLATLFTFAGLASLGLPGLAGFVAEYITFTASYQVTTIITAVAVFTMILTASYLLWMLKRVFYGPFNTKWNWLQDANWREAIPLTTLGAVIVFVGIYPAFLIGALTPSLSALMHAASTLGLIH